MPVKKDKSNKYNKKWNLYINEFEKLEYLKALASSGKNGAQSAGIRAFMYLYVNDIELRNKVNNIIDDYIVYKANGQKSLL